MPELYKRSTEDEIGIVSELKDGRAVVDLNFNEACESCGAKIICVPDQKGKRRLQVENKLNAKIGNQVTIAEKSNFMLKISFLQYGLPLIGFMAAILLFSRFNIKPAGIPAELILFLAGLLGLFLSALVARKIINKIARKDTSFFKISEILS